jgi:broad specificity phosphatase PhoE
MHMTRLLLTRHGETDHNRNRIIQGQLDTDLNETGIEQAQQLSERLRDDDVTAVYASTLQRSRRTAEIIAGPHDLEVQSLEELNERSYGELEGEPAEKRQQRIEETGTPWHAWTPENGESPSDVAQRTVPAIEQIRKAHNGETVVAVAHGSVNKAVLATMLGADSGHSHVIRQHNTCINELEFEEYRGWRINRLNDVAHLDD